MDYILAIINAVAKRKKQILYLQNTILKPISIMKKILFIFAFIGITGNMAMAQIDKYVVIPISLPPCFGCPPRTPSFCETAPRLMWYKDIPNQTVFLCSEYRYDIDLLGRPTAVPIKVGINTDVPSKELDVVGRINANGYFLNGNAVSFSQWVNNGTNIFFSTGNVGIGSNTPNAKLEIANNGSATNLFIRSTNTSPWGYASIFETTKMPNGVYGDTKAIAIHQKDATTVSENIVLWGNGNASFQGSVCIGTTNPGSMKLAVNGTIGARVVRVTQTTPFPDFVFESDYNLMPLNELEQYVKTNKHLPEIPRAVEVVADNGIDLGEMNTKLLQKVEELTLYIIEQNKRIEKLEQK